MPSDSEKTPARTGESTTERRRARLLAATVEVAGERGWSGMALSDVVARAGLSKRSVYDLFGDKLACFLAAAHAVIARVSALTLAAYRSASSPRAGIAAAIEALLRFCGQDPRAGRVYLVETAAAGPAGAALWREHMEAMSERAACALGGLRPGLSAHAGSMAVGGVYTVAQARVLAGDARALPALAPDMTAALWTMLGIE